MAKRNSEPCALDMTPMIDVVFQLMIFFIVTIKMGENVNRDVKLELARRGPLLKGEDNRSITIEVDRRGWITIQNAAVSKQMLSTLLQNRYNKYGTYPVLIRGDFRTKHTDIRAVMDICANIGLARVSFVGIKEKKAGG